LEPSSVPTKAVGILFYPGGFVKPEAYLLALSPLAAEGYPVVVFRMPFDLAFFDAERGFSSLSSVPGVRKWVIGGHSLGGVAAAIAVDKHRDAFGGIIFWASFPAKDNDLSGLNLPALSISASNDGLSTRAKVEAASGYLPRGAVRVVIEGGTHAQFADYGPQKGDGAAAIDRRQQQSETNAAVLEFLAKL
jgi:pimeloyl-ACP methyl ester carboxylesterase